MLPLLLLALSQDPGPAEIIVDEHCRVYTQDRPGPTTAYSRPGFHDGSALCRLKGDSHSSHWEESVANGVVSRTKVQIHERSYLLFNPTDTRVAFLISVSLPDGWIIDSMPKPAEILDHMATFRLYAKPGETVQLHIGERKVTRRLFIFVIPEGDQQSAAH